MIYSLHFLFINLHFNLHFQFTRAYNEKCLDKETIVKLCKDTVVYVFNLIV